MTSKRVARKASKLLRKAKSYVIREVSGSDLAQAAQKMIRKPAKRKKLGRLTRRR